MTFNMPGKDATWEERGGWVVNALIRDLTLTREQAAGPVGNMGAESEEFTAFHEKGQPDGKGGYGWAQWTASRRVAFFAWCDAQGLDPNSDEGNYSYLLQDLRTTYRATVTALRKCLTIEESTWSFGQTFERPAGTTKDNLPGYDKRLSYAKRAYAGSLASVPITPSVVPKRVVDKDQLADIIRAAQREVGAVPDGRLGPISYKLIVAAQAKLT